MPRFGHNSYVTVREQEVSKRDPESNLLLHKAAGMILEGLNNYLALLGWSIARPRHLPWRRWPRLTSRREPEPGALRLQLASSLTPSIFVCWMARDFRGRLVPFLHRGEPVSKTFEALYRSRAEILTEAALLIQTRIQVWVRPHVSVLRR